MCVEARGWCWMSSFNALPYFRNRISLTLELTRVGQQAPGTCPVLPDQGWDYRQLGTRLPSFSCRSSHFNQTISPLSSHVCRMKFVIAYALYLHVAHTSAPDTWWFEAGRMDETIGKKLQSSLNSKVSLSSINTRDCYLASLVTWFTAILPLTLRTNFR